MEIYQSTQSKTIKNIAKGTGISLLITLILLFIFSAILTYTNISENTITPVILVITAISILIGSSIGNMKIKRNGILNGGIIRKLIHINIIFSFKHFKLEIWIKCTKCNNDYSWIYLWGIRRNRRSKQKIKFNGGLGTGTL